MLPEPQPPSSERLDTDQCLHVEREKTDEELGKRDEALGVGAVLRKARDRADTVLESARGQADAALAREGASNRELHQLNTERRAEDLSVQHERETADAQLEDERQSRLEALASLLRLESDETDERLVLERARSDGAVIARDDFMAMVSHDLRTLLGGIALATHVQIRRAPADEGGRAAVVEAKRVQRLIARMNRLIGDLDDVASIESGRFRVTRKERDGRKVVLDCVEAFEPSAAIKHITLSARVPERAVMAKLDDQRILQVLANLVGNALKFTPANGSITLQVEPTDGGMRVSVTDTGPGIAEENLEAVFERFWQVGEADHRGRGLGLFISRQIVEAHGGRIWATSELGKGTTFVFTLPDPTKTSS